MSLFQGVFGDLGRWEGGVWGRGAGGWRPVSVDFSEMTRFDRVGAGKSVE